MDLKRLVVFVRVEEAEKDIHRKEDLYNPHPLPVVDIKRDASKVNKNPEPSTNKLK